MRFTQLTSCNNLRDIEVSLNTMSHKQYHVAIHKSLSKSIFHEQIKKDQVQSLDISIGTDW
jgi:hypothetical protein